MDFWKVDKNQDNNDVVVRDRTTGDIIANCSVDATRDFGMTEEENREYNISDAKLMSAAPELLRACLDAVEWWDDWTKSDDPHNVGDMNIERIRSAIDTATRGVEEAEIDPPPVRKKYRVLIRRNQDQMAEFVVEAADGKEAEALALDKSYDHDWSTEDIDIDHFMCDEPGPELVKDSK